MRVVAVAVLGFFLIGCVDDKAATPVSAVTGASSGILPLDFSLTSEVLTGGIIKVQIGGSFTSQPEVLVVPGIDVDLDSALLQISSGSLQVLESTCSTGIPVQCQFDSNPDKIVSGLSSLDYTVLIHHQSGGVDQWGGVPVIAQFSVTIADLTEAKGEGNESEEEEQTPTELPGVALTDSQIRDRYNIMVDPAKKDTNAAETARTEIAKHLNHLLTTDSYKKHFDDATRTKMTILSDFYVRQLQQRTWGGLAIAQFGSEVLRTVVIVPYHDGVINKATVVEFRAESIHEKKGHLQPVDFVVMKYASCALRPKPMILFQGTSIRADKAHEDNGSTYLRPFHLLFEVPNENHSNLISSGAPIDADDFTALLAEKGKPARQGFVFNVAQNNYAKLKLRFVTQFAVETTQVGGKAVTKSGQLQSVVPNIRAFGTPDDPKDVLWGKHEMVTDKKD